MRGEGRSTCIRPSPLLLLAIAVVNVLFVLYLVHRDFLRLAGIHLDYATADGGLQELHLDDFRNRQSCHPGSLGDECIREAGAALARAFPERTNQTWCIPSSTSSENDGLEGIILIKVPKAASSTSAGVAIRIGRRRNCEKLKWQHRLAHEFETINPNKSFVFTTIRDPGSRAVSSIFFHYVSRTNASDNDALVLKHLTNNTHPHYGTRSDGQGGFQLRYTAFHQIDKDSVWEAKNPSTVKNPLLVMEHVQRTIQAYDFIILTERMEESLVAMALLLGLDVGDLLVTSSKVAGSRYHLAKPKGGPLQCYPTAKSYVSPFVNAFLHSDEWRAANYGDYLLHVAANYSLDKTIEQLGKERFERALSRYRMLRRKEQELCAPYVQFPCSNDGKPQPLVAKDHCYFRNYDFGCGYKCIDEMLTKELG